MEILNSDLGVKGTYVHTVTLEGFKSYGIKAVIDGLNPGLNFIAGPSQTGKSSFLDAICLVLGLNHSHLRDDAPEELIFGHGKTSIKKAIVSLALKRPDSGESVTVISLEISADQSRPVYKVDGEARTEEDVKQLLHTMHFDASYPHLHFSKEEIEWGLSMPSFYILKLLHKALGFGSQRRDLENRIFTYSNYLNEMQCEINKLNDEKKKLEAWSANNIELVKRLKIYIGFEYQRLDFERSKAETELARIQLDFQNLKSEKERFVAESQRAEKHKYTTTLSRNVLASNLQNEEDLLQIKKNQLGQKQEQVKQVQNECQILEKSLELKQKMETFKQLSEYFVGESSSSAGPPLKKTKVEVKNQQLINGLFTQLSTAIEEGFKPMTESQVPERDEQLLSTKRQLLRTCLGEQSKLEAEVIASQTEVDKLKVDLNKVEAELDQLILEMRQHDHRSGIKSLNEQNEVLDRKVANSEAIIQSLSLKIENLCKPHSWLKEEINNFRTFGNEAEFAKAYEKAKEEFQVLQAEQNDIEPTLIKNVDKRLKQWHDRSTEVLTETIPELEHEPTLFKNVDKKLKQWHDSSTEVLTETIPELEHELRELDLEQAPKLEERRHVVNAYFGQILSFLLPECVARLEKLEGIEDLGIAINKTKEAGAIMFADMGEVEKWLVFLSLYLAILRSADSNICLLDMSHSYFDSNSNLKAKFHDMIKNVFKESQFIVTTMNEEKVVDSKSFKLRAEQTIVVSEAL